MGSVMTPSIAERSPAPLSARWSERPWTAGAKTALKAGARSEDLVELIQTLGQTATLGRDEMLFCEGDEADAVYVVLSGTVRCCKLLADGRRQIIGFYQAGQLLGLALGDHHSYSAEAVTLARLRRLGRAELESLLEERPALRRRLFSVAASELAAAQEQMLLLGRKTARERICTFLLARLGGDGRTIELPMSRSDIADYLGLTIETVSRTLSQLRSAGLIRMPGLNSLELIDAGRLCALADSPAPGATRDAA
jgi:CRP/FNR family transcriptional regulator